MTPSARGRALPSKRCEAAAVATGMIAPPPTAWTSRAAISRSEEHTSELQSRQYLHSFPTRRSSDLCPRPRIALEKMRSGRGGNRDDRAATNRLDEPGGDQLVEVLGDACQNLDQP